MQRYTLQKILQLTVEHFAKLELPTPRLDAEVLLADMLGIERIQLYVRFDQPLNKEEVDRFRERVRARSKRCPVAYITGKKEFMSREFKVSREVLIPRPETVHLVEAVIEYLKEREEQELMVADIATGSGVVAVSLAASLPGLKLVATDLSSAALKLAAINARQQGVTDRIELLQGHLLEPLPSKSFDVLVSNPPYIPSSEYKGLLPEVKDYEPREALVAGEDGLKYLKPLISGAGEYLTPGGLLALELGADQLEDVTTLLGEANYSRQRVIKDYAGISRVVLATYN